MKNLLSTVVQAIVDCVVQRCVKRKWQWYAWSANNAGVVAQIQGNLREEDFLNRILMFAKLWKSPALQKCSQQHEGTLARNNGASSPPHHMQKQLKKKKRKKVRKNCVFSRKFTPF